MRESRSPISGDADAAGEAGGDALLGKEVSGMTVSRKDVTATALTMLVVLVFVATHEAWGVPLIGDSRRWVAGTIMLLGVLTCAQGTPGKGKGTAFLAMLGILALGLALVTLITGSLTLLSVLVVDIFVLWAASTLRHAWHAPRKPIPT